MRILIVEDDLVMADGLIQTLKDEGHAVDWVDNGEMADRMLSNEAYNLAILDLGLPKMDGFQVLSRLRQRNSSVPVMILSAWDSLDDRVKGLNMGADDYLTKPFELPEFEARVRALLRRRWSDGENLLCLGKLCLDIIGHKVLINNVPLDLSAREFAVMQMLMQRTGRLVSAEQLLEHLYGLDEEASNNAIQVTIHRLRKKLEAHGIFIKTVRGLGYFLDIPPKN